MMSDTFVATACGLVLGVAVALIWNAVLTYFGKPEFWRAVADFTKTAISGANDAEFFRQYAALLKHLAAYVGQNLLTIALAFFPVALFALVAWPFAHEYRNQRANRLAFYPVQPLTIVVNGQSVRLEPKVNLMPIPADRTAPLEIGIDHVVLRCRTLTENWAFTSSAWNRWLLSALDFEVELSPNYPPLLLVRPTSGSRNPLWPYLNDLEFAFMASLSLTSCGGILAMKINRHRVRRPLKN